MPVAEAADGPGPGHAVPIAELAPQRIAGVRRVGDHAACANDVGDLDDRAPLRVGRMDVEVPGHAMSLEVSPRSGWYGARLSRPRAARRDNRQGGMPIVGVC